MDNDGITDVIAREMKKAMDYGDLTVFYQNTLKNEWYPEIIDRAIGIYDGLVVDIGNVCTVGREIANKTQVTNRITYYEADFQQDDLPTGFDMILECDVGVYSEKLFKKLWNSLNKGGRFVIISNTNEQGAWVTHKKSKPSFFWYLHLDFLKQ